MKTPRAPRIKLDVTQEIIDQSIERDSSHCVVAEAVRLAYPMAQRIAVDLQTIRLTDPKRNLRYTYLTPRSCQVALVNFDQGVKPSPFSVQLSGAQVTSANPRHSGSQAKPESEAQREQRLEALRKTRIEASPSDKRVGNVPDRIGGRTPPLMNVAHRRAFGLRGLIL